ncbi:MAG: arginine--tRNA ligase [Candidatus Omnitrophica bacterium]|nr:arginine--tRNA ligase [Candidatus Omnitrophota bacterium]
MVDIEKAVLTLLKESADKLKEYFAFKDSPEITLDIPKQSSFGDLASNIALQIGHRIRHPAKEIAHIMVDQIKLRIKNPPYCAIIKNCEVGAPGFINFFLKGECLYHVLARIKKEAGNFGRNEIGCGIKTNIEFVSANPTGPLTIAHGRQAAFGDSLANILKFSGFKVYKEYYLNDEGRQINLLGASIRARYLELINEKTEFPQDGYRGEYVKDIAGIIKKRNGARKAHAPLSFFSDYGYKVILKDIKRDLIAFGVKFNTWFSQRKLTKGGNVKKALSILDKNGHTYMHEGALWLKSSAFGDEKDRVIIKSDKAFTYLGPDIAYHMDKYKRGFTRLINTWGPDHHGYIPRIKAAITGLGLDADALSVLIIQLVTLYRGKTPIPMSTRAGSFITLKEVMDEIGRDCARYFFLRRKRDSHLDFDLELAKKQTLDNPVYYIQYAHARISSIIKHAGDTMKIGADAGHIDLMPLKTKEEFNILRMLRQFPFAVRSSAEGYEPYRMVSYLEELAKSFHSFYSKHRVVSQEDLALTRARLLLVDCIRIVIANGLRLLGVSAPTQM